MGLNVGNGEVEDLLKSGIGDPTMVTRSALQNAASIAKNILTTEAVVAEAPEKAGAMAGRRRNARHGRDDVTSRSAAFVVLVVLVRSLTAKGVGSSRPPGLRRLAAGAVS